MKLEKAIEILQHSLEHGSQPRIEDLNGATQLGIEALKRVELHKERHTKALYPLLPGETED